MRSEKTPENQVNDGPKRGASILVVDDELFIRTLLTDVLTKEGYVVTTAADGEEAVGLLEKERFDLVITDLAMPGINGIEVLLAAKRVDDDYQVIVITGYPSASDIKKIMRIGAADFIMKPFNVDWIKFSVVKALEVRRRLSLPSEERAAEQIVATDAVAVVRSPKVFVAMLEVELGRSEFRGHSCSLLEIRVDSYHTEVGREGAGLLKHFERVLQQAARPGDVIAQTGQRDFTMILPETSLEQALSLGKRVTGKIDWWTMSAGVVCFPEDATTTAELLKKVRAARQSSKNALEG